MCCVKEVTCSNAAKEIGIQDPQCICIPNARTSSTRVYSLWATPSQEAHSVKATFLAWSILSQGLPGKPENSVFFNMTRIKAQLEV